MEGSEESGKPKSKANSRRRSKPNSRDDSQTSRSHQSRRNKLKSVFVVHGIKDEDAGVQDDGLLI